MMPSVVACVTSVTSDPLSWPASLRSHTLCAMGTYTNPCWSPLTLLMIKISCCDSNHTPVASWLPVSCYGASSLLPHDLVALLLLNSDCNTPVCRRLPLHIIVLPGMEPPPHLLGLIFDTLVRRDRDRHLWLLNVLVLVVLSSPSRIRHHKVVIVVPSVLRVIGIAHVSQHSIADEIRPRGKRNARSVLLP